MCGGLVTASCNGGRDVLKYQVGRLLGYAFVGTLAFSMGYILKSVIPFDLAPLYSGIFLGFLFIFWGVQSFQGKRVEIPLPPFLRKLYQFFFRNVSGKSFFVGLISILLPCGLIYGLIISALAFGSYEQVLISLLFFWLGTLPAMIGAPQLIRKILDPFRRKLPRIYAIVFIVMGIVTIGGRLQHLPTEKSFSHTTDGAIHRCH